MIYIVSTAVPESYYINMWRLKYVSIVLVT